MDDDQGRNELAEAIGQQVEAGYPTATIDGATAVFWPPIPQITALAAALRDNPQWQRVEVILPAPPGGMVQLIGTREGHALPVIWVNVRQNFQVRG